MEHAGRIIRGRVFVVGDHVDTDQIIPAEHLSYDPSDPAERKFFAKHAMSGVPAGESGLPGGNVPFVEEGKFSSGFAVIVAGVNFGCGSSREHAPLALAEAGCSAVVAQSYARIFYRNSINGGYLLPLETPERAMDKFATGDEVEIGPDAGEIKNLTTGAAAKLNSLGDAARIVSAGGIFEHARQTGMLKKMDGAEMLDIRDVAGGVVISVKVVPGASRDKIVGVLGDALKITTSAPAEKGKANAAVAKLLAKALAVAPRAVKLASGQTSPRKEFQIDGMTVEAVRKQLEAHG